MSAQAERTAQKYFGATARGYEDKRIGQEKWQAEDRIVRAWLAEYEPGTQILDCPCGTGRFIPFYAECGFSVDGIDVSKDMLAIAATKTPRPDSIGLREGSIFALPLADKSVDVAVAVRIMNLIDADDMTKALAELQRVARRAIIFNLRVWHEQTRFRRPQKMATLHDALTHEWRIARDVEIHESDFRMFMLCNG